VTEKLLEKSLHKDKKHRADGQISGLAGELFVAAELLKRGLQTSITFGNAKSIDLLAHCPLTDRHFAVQVKAVRARNWFLLKPERINRAHVYVFVILNKPGVPVQYFIVQGAELLDNVPLFGKGLQDWKMPGVTPASLTSYENNWAIFSGAAPASPELGVLR